LDGRYSGIISCIMEVTNQLTTRLLTPFLNTISNFRVDVRNFARKQEHSKILEACDKLRDEILPLLGVRLEDLPDGSIWKLGNKEEMIKEIQQKKEAELAKAAAKQKEKELRLEKERQLLEKSKVPPTELFTAQLDKFSQFDETGFPQKDVEGKDLSKSLIKQLRKEYDVQAKLHQKYLESLPQKS